MLPTVRFGTLAAALLLAASLACSGEQTEARAGAPPSENDAQTVAAADPVVAAAPDRNKKKPRKERKERPLPAFSGWSLDDERIEVSKLLGKRLLLVFFNPEVKIAPDVIRGVIAVSDLRGDHNFRILGVAIGSDRKTAKAFAAEHGIDFPVIDDATGSISNRVGLRTPAAVLGIDAEGYVEFGYAQFPEAGPATADMIEQQVRTALRLPAAGDSAAPGPGHRPVAPDFSADVLDGDEPFELAAQRGRSVVLMFFLHTCSHCHQAIRSVQQIMASLPEDKQPVFVGIEVTGRTYAVRQKLRELKLDFFPVLFDDDGSIRNAYGVFAGVPDIYLIDAEGRVAAHVQGWREQEDPPLLRMRIAKAAGAPVPMLLRSKGYTGGEACGVCHESEFATWQLTPHASAFDTLVKHGAATDEECVGCHVVGYEQRGGFESAKESPHLEDVGCESCHGRGGPHLSPGFVPAESYETACLTCHDTKHSLGFEYATFLPKVSHAANRFILTLPPEERAKILAERGAPRTDILPTNASYVGSDACASCHAAEAATWHASPHAGAGRTLVKEGKAAAAECVACHSTALGRPGGLPSGGTPESHPDLFRVGCESCHGPGSAHVGEDTAKIGTIVSLGDKCDSCVILQICGSCHDQANDPGFEFEVLDKIEKQRHGTIEAGTGKPLGDSARRVTPPSTEAILGRAFDAIAGRG
jgi:peroxiredoxin